MEKRAWDLLSPEKRRFCVAEIIHFFKTERNEEIGIIAAEGILDLLLKTIGAELYNRGVEDSKNILKKGIDNMESDVDSLIKRF